MSSSYNLHRVHLEQRMAQLEAQVLAGETTAKYELERCKNALKDEEVEMYKAAMQPLTIKFQPAPSSLTSNVKPVNDQTPPKPRSSKRRAPKQTIQLFDPFDL